MSITRQRLRQTFSEGGAQEIYQEIKSEGDFLGFARRYAFDEDYRVARSALWGLTKASNEELSQLQVLLNELTDQAMQTENSSVRRLSLNIIERLKIDEKDLRTDFLDFCFEHMVSIEEYPGIQTLCMKLAYRMCNYNGAVFIPRASMRDGASAGPGGDGHYWTTTPGYALHFTNSDLSSSYGYCYKYYGFAVRLVRAADPEEPYVLQQDGEGNYLLGNLLDWKAFAELVQTNPTANAKMTADINLGNDQTMIGSLSVPYAGIFDGQGHTLTVAYNQSDIKEGIGPFYVLGAATIQNLHVDGSMLTRCGIGGIAGIVKGNATIQRCWVSATLQSNGYSPRGTIGGICSVLEGVDDAHLIIEDCLFDGTIVDNEFCGGFMSHVERASCSVTMRRGLNIGTYPTTTNENGTFIREVLSGVRYLEASTLFHKKVFGKAQGTQVTDEQLADGTIATALQAGRAEEIWVQDPVLHTPMLKVFANEDPDTPTGIGETNANASASKVLHNGQLLIEKNGKFYSATGAEVK